MVQPESLLEVYALFILLLNASALKYVFARLFTFKYQCTLSPEGFELLVC